MTRMKGIVNPDFPENYARFCAEAMERGQIVVCAMHPNTLLRKIAVEPVPKEVQWWEAQGRFENLIGAEFCRGVSKPFFDNFCDSPAFYANASPDVVRNYYMKVVKNQWWS